ncbi:MAG: AmmeMemoRadiSam system radical SAM enzyme, partial [Anaerolineales bacterium]
FHFLPGSDALTFGMLGCDFHCDFCQNYLTSQFLRDPAADLATNYIRRISAEQIVKLAIKSGAKVIASSYNEPLITSEWAVAIFRLAVQEGIKCVYVSNGNATPEVLQYLRPYLSGYKVDLKTMQDKQYRQIGGVLKNVLDTIRLAHQMGYWVEVVTLVIPGFNDSVAELMDAARFIVSVSPDIPWHVTAYHPDYKLSEPPPTPVSTLLKAVEIGQEAGLHYVYAGNVVGRVKDYESTFCPHCQALLIKRYGYTIQEYHITAEGKCPKCGTPIAGVWHANPDEVKLGGWGMPRAIF